MVVPTEGKKESEEAGEAAQHPHNGRLTKISIDDAFWKGLLDIARRQDRDVNAVIEDVVRNRETSNLTAAVRAYVFQHLRT